MHERLRLVKFMVYMYGFHTPLHNFLNNERIALQEIEVMDACIYLSIMMLPLGSFGASMRIYA